MRRFRSFRPEYRLSVRLSRCSKTCAYKSSIITLQISTEYVLTLSAAKTLFSQKWIHSSGRKLCFLCPKLEYLTLLANINVMAENTVKRTNDVGESRGETCHMITAGLFLLRPAFADRLNLLKSLLVWIKFSDSESSTILWTIFGTFFSTIYRLWGGGGETDHWYPRRSGM